MTNANLPEHVPYRVKRGGVTTKIIVTLAKFWSQVDKTGECWLWTGTLTKHEYGWFRDAFAHRVSYVMANGAIPQGLNVLHSCDVRRCVRPAHLSTGTQQQNIADMMTRRRHFSHLGTGKPQKGSLNSASKLTEEQVREIRILYSPRFNASVLAQAFSVSESNITQIVSRKTWGHVE